MMLARMIAICAVLCCFCACGGGVSEQVEKDQQAQQEEAAPVESEEFAEPYSPPEDQVEEQPQESTKRADISSLQSPDIRFDFDQANLKPKSREVLNKIAFSMFDYPELTLVIEGHCDERGSNEYNLALGERRARAAKDYLIQMGVEPHRIDAISFGEEKPLDTRHNVAAWAKNRRDTFVITAEEATM
ncbi:peptidoglycan-associated lipoprotein Pal [bacterium]|nr:peptidoglycan-associated lipoprotein Pal [bacterium]